MTKSETGKKKWSSFMKLDQFQKKSENHFSFFFRTCNRLHLKSGMNFLVMIFAIWSKIEKKYTIHDQFSVTSFTVSVKLWHKKSDFSTVFKITIDEMFFMKNHASFWNHHMWEHFHFFFRNCHFGSMKLSTFSLFWVKLWKKKTLFLWN